MTHTPGTWRIAYPAVFTNDNVHDRLIIAPENRHVAEVFQYQNHEYVIGQDEAEANARLIAAAPDLLVALEDMLNAWEGYEMLAALDHRIQDKARAAIARAKG